MGNSLGKNLANARSLTISHFHCSVARHDVTSARQHACGRRSRKSHALEVNRSITMKTRSRKKVHLYSSTPLSRNMSRIAHMATPAPRCSCCYAQRKQRYSRGTGAENGRRRGRYSTGYSAMLLYTAVQYYYSGMILLLYAIESQGSLPGTVLYNILFQKKEHHILIFFLDLD